MTSCQKENKRAMTMRSRTPIGLFIARCLPDGSFDPVQCNNMTGFCWCVDKRGNELAGTQQWGKPNCTDIGLLEVNEYKLKYTCLVFVQNGIISRWLEEEVHRIITHVAPVHFGILSK